MTSRKKIVCIAGCGAIGALHAKNLSRSANLMFYSRTAQSSEHFNRKFSGVGIFTNYDEVITSSKVDAVVIASPPEYHKDQTIEALQAEKYVLVEKPLCNSAQELDEIEAAAHGQPERLMVAENYYYKPLLTAIKKFIRDNTIGRIINILIRKEFMAPPSGWKKAYGALHEGGIHFVALLSGILEDSPETIEAEFSNISSSLPEKNSVLTLRYQNDVSATLRYSWETPSLTKGIFQHSTIAGTEGKIVFESNGIYILVCAHRKRKLTFPSLKDIGGYHAMTQDFMQCLYNPEHTPYSNFPRAKRDLSIVFDAYKQAGL